MKLIYDMRHLTGDMHGMARYGLELLDALLARNDNLGVGVLLNLPEHGKLLPKDPRVVGIACGLKPYGYKAQRMMPTLLGPLDIDVYHCPFYGAPVRYKGPMVMTIHDLIHLRFPKHYSLKHRMAYRMVVGPAAKRAGAVLTVSQHSKQDLVSILRVPEGKVVVTGNGVGPVFKPLAPAERGPAARELEFPQDYILAVGNPKHHKNLGPLIKAHQSLAQSASDGPPIPPLVLVGVEPEFVPIAKPSQSLVFSRRLDDQELAKAYGAARMVVVPSLYEGFGLPALEALACGAPLVSSNRASLPEVVSEAGLLCDPDPESLTQAMAQMLADKELREAYRKAGPLQAKKFSWAKTAAKTMEVYRQVAARWS